eukprot:1144463-Pelagomonas_calceolata.AAC.1
MSPGTTPAVLSGTCMCLPWAVYETVHVLAVDRSIGKATSKAARRASMQGPPSTEKNGQHTVVVLPFPSEQEDGGGRGTAKDGDSRAQPVHGAHAAAPSHSADKSIS